MGDVDITVGVAKQLEEYVSGVWTKKQTEVARARVLVAVY